MLAIHNQFTHHMRNRLKTIGLGLGLVRLLQDARRFEDAKTTLYSLENGFQGIEANRPSQKPCKPSRLKGVRVFSPGPTCAIFCTRSLSVR